MEDNTEISREILNHFLERWNFNAVQKMTLQQYVSVGDKDTFCQWIETRTKPLGSIKGISSIKFGIYKRANPKHIPKIFRNDEQYSWRAPYGTSRSKAYLNIKGLILQTIKYAKSGQFQLIDAIRLTTFVKWKIAFLYSNERLIPIFSRNVLIKIANHFGLSANNRTPISQIQEIMIANKPAHLSIYEYSYNLYLEFSGTAQKQGKEPLHKRRTIRKAAQSKSTNVQVRVNSGTYIASQKHNELQLALERKLIAKYGRERVFLEKDFIDITVVLPKRIMYYEVKSSAYASDCVKEALGQILSYAHRSENSIPKYLVVAGQYTPNEDELKYIEYVKKNLKINFSYENIEMSD